MQKILFWRYLVSEFGQAAFQQHQELENERPQRVILSLGV